MPFPKVVYPGIIATLLSFVAMSCATEALAQPTPVAAVPAPPVTTIWHRLGIPQAFVRVRDNTLNRNGNFPGLEKKPPVLRLADAANLESPNDAIRAAAEVKKEEDLAKQKIKALKYLATIGCGCYDKDGKIEKAILAGLNDCTPEVRMAAIDAIVYVVGSCDPQSQYGYSPSRGEKIKECLADHSKCDEIHDKMRMMGVGKKCQAMAERIGEVCPLGESCQCEKCRGGSACSACAGCCGHCCSEKIQKRLAEMAFEEKNGCYVEPIADIREAARKALCLCPAPICEEKKEEEKEPEEAETVPVEKKGKKASEGQEGGEGEDLSEEDDEEATDEGSTEEDSAEEDPSEQESAEEELGELPAPTADDGASAPILSWPGNSELVLVPTRLPGMTPAGLAVRRSAQPVIPVEPANLQQDAEVGANYAGVVEVTSPRETLVTMRERVAFSSGQRVMCVLNGEPNVTATVVQSEPGRVALRFDGGERLRNGSALQVRALDLPAQPQPVEPEVLLAKTPRGMAIASDVPEEDLATPVGLSQPRLVEDWQPTIVR